MKILSIAVNGSNQTCPGKWQIAAHDIATTIEKELTSLTDEDNEVDIIVRFVDGERMVSEYVNQFRLEGDE